MLTSGVLVGCGQSQPPYFKASGEPVNLVNNSRAYDHTWHEVAGFLQWDTTDEEAYTTEHMCGYFAEELHNRAEYYGFKTAFVSVEFEEGEPHALNAFNTVGFGLIYVDCTGKGLFEAPAPADTFTDLAPVEHWDKVAYIVEGEKMGFISLGYEEQDFSYNWYNECRAKQAKFERDLDKYNSDVNKYNSDMNTYNSDVNTYKEEFKDLDLPPLGDNATTGQKAYRKWFEEWWERSGQYREPVLPPELSLRAESLELERQRLIKEKNRLISEWATVRGYNWQESDSPVTHIEVYW